VTFPAFKNSAECKDPTTGTVLWTFHRRASGLYEAEVRETAAALHPSSAAANSAPPIHPTTILHQRLGHMGVGSMRTVISAQSIKGLPATFVAPLTSVCNGPPSLHSRENSGSPSPSWYLRGRLAAVRSSTWTWWDPCLPRLSERHR